MNTRCPICAANIQSDEKPKVCPACKEDISALLHDDEGGITTATAKGPGLKPLTDSIQDVY